MDTWKSEPESSTGKCRILCDDGHQVVEEPTVMKVEEDPEPVQFEEVLFVVKEEWDPEPTTFTEIQTESAVSCTSMYACVQCCAQRTDTQSCLPLCQRETLEL